LRNDEPKINVFNRQKSLPVDRRLLLEFAEAIADRLRFSAGLSIVLVSDRAIRRYNRDFRGKDQPTDVLSFACEGSEHASEEPYLGDILISVETAERQKRADLTAELKTLTLHGILHLLGYDHLTDRGEMEELESRLKREFSLD
jgi:probable rRNA maturation factor